MTELLAGVDPIGRLSIRCDMSKPPQSRTRVLVVEPDPLSRQAVLDVLSRAGHEGQATISVHDTLARLDEEPGPDLILAELRLGDGNGLQLLQRLGAAGPDVPIITMTAFGTVEDAVTAMRHGATDFLSKPFTDDEVLLAIDRAIENRRLRIENHDLRQALDDRVDLGNYIATDPAMHAVTKTVQAVAGTRTTVLITGESGTGKTLLARAIHNLSPRRDQPFVEVNCGALPESLLESELFGHVKGAFTGAVKDRPGKFEAAAGGTIFLDEIGTSSAAFQVKLLRVLQDRCIERVGDSATIEVDVRIILATNLDLWAAVQAGDFREDLFYRIQVVTLEVPPLRQRRADIPYLAEHFLRRAVAESGRLVNGISGPAMDILVRSPWPGNIRQLENVIERAVVLGEHEILTPNDLPAALRHTPDATNSPATTSLLAADSHLLPLKEALEAPERAILERALSHHDGNRNATARALGINRSTLFNKMRKYHLL